jgi:hypothetical protein
MSDEEKAKLGYQMAIQMIMYEGQLIWRSLAVMVTVNTLMVAMVGIAAKTYPELPGRKFIPWLGIALCFCWFLVMKRLFGLYRYWFASARALESRYLAPVVATVSLGAAFARGDVVKVGTKDEKLNWCERSFKAQWLMFVVIAIFVFLHCLLLTL